MNANETVRCASCDARNPARAEWCSQCFTSLLPSEPAPPEPAPPESSPPEPLTQEPPTPRPGLPSVFAPEQSVPTTQPSEPASDAGATSPIDPAATPEVAPLTSGDGRYRRSGDTVQWCCVSCQEWNDVGLVTCTTCGTSMAGRSINADRDIPEGVEPNEVRLASYLLPGGGQWLLGQKGRAVGRILMGALFLLGGLVLVVSGASSGLLAVVPGLLLLIGSATIWVLSALDVRTILAGGRRELLDDRVFLWLVVGVLGAVIASLLLAAIPAISG